jgi:hypothetical protein
MGITLANSPCKYFTVCYDLVWCVSAVHGYFGLYSTAAPSDDGVLGSNPSSPYTIYFGDFMGTRILDAEQLKKLSDRSLLIYYKKVRNYCYAMRFYDDEPDQHAIALCGLRDRIKSELYDREHVPRRRNPGGANINDKTGDPKLKHFGRKSGRMK